MQQDIINIDLKLPTGWEDLTDKQLRYLFGLLSLNFPSQQVKTYCLFRWSGMQVMHRYGKGWYCKFAKDEFVIFAPQINAAITSLDCVVARKWLTPVKVSANREQYKMRMRIFIAEVPPNLRPSES